MTHGPTRGRAATLTAAGLIAVLLVAWLAMAAMHLEHGDATHDGHAMTSTEAMAVDAMSGQTHVDVPAAVCRAFTDLATNRSGPAGPMLAAASLAGLVFAATRSSRLGRTVGRTRQGPSPPRLEALGISRR
jgi:hypothetical protein